MKLSLNACSFDMDIKRLAELYHGFYIDTPTGNNAFSYVRRSLRRIYVPPLIKGSVDDVRPGDEVVFCDVLDEREVQAKGLKNFVHIERPGQNIFIFDNHNHAFTFWAAGLDAGAFPGGLDLVHVDQHKDTRQPAEWFTGHGMAEAFHYTQEVLNVGNFIPPAVKAGWFRDVVQVGSAEVFAREIAVPFVLDIDLDIFAPIMGYISDDVKISALREWTARASFITIATSPFFVEEERALHYLPYLI